MNFFLLFVLASPQFTRTLYVFLCLCLRHMRELTIRIYTIFAFNREHKLFSCEVSVYNLQFLFSYGAVSITTKKYMGASWIVNAGSCSKTSCSVHVQDTFWQFSEFVPSNSPFTIRLRGTLLLGRVKVALQAVQLWGKCLWTSVILSLKTGNHHYLVQKVVQVDIHFSVCFQL